MTRRRGDIPPNAGARQSRTMRLAQVRTALLQAMQAGVRPQSFLVGDDTRDSLAVIEAATREGGADVILARLVAQERERIERGADRSAAHNPEEQP